MRAGVPRWAILAANHRLLDTKEPDAVYPPVMCRCAQAPSMTSSPRPSIQVVTDGGTRQKKT